MRATFLPPADRLALLLDAERIPYRREVRFHPVRRWKADFFVEGVRKVLIEVEGGGWLPGGGRHNRGKGFAADMEKYNEALCLGFVVLRVNPQMIDSGSALLWLRKLLTTEGA